MARVALYAYERDPLDLIGWVLDRVEAQHPLGDGMRVVDIGCGPGRYLAALATRHPGIASVGLDLSRGMAAATRDIGAPAAVADATQLPIRSASCAVAIAAHMLYHVPDIARAAAELARVTGPEGLVAIVVNGRNHLRELDEVASAAYAAVTGAPWAAPTRSSVRFLLDDAVALVAPALTVVDVHRMSREIVVTDPQPVVAYIESEESLFDPVLPAGTRWADVLREAGARVRAIIERDGAFTIHTDAGVALYRSA
jgi:Methylase involved in ubiquinone/menaquinone biosynthesis